MVIRRQLRLPHGIGGCSAAKGPIEASKITNFRRSEVEEDASDATLRNITEARTYGGAVGAVGEPRERCTHTLSPSIDRSSMGKSQVMLPHPPRKQTIRELCDAISENKKNGERVA